MLVLVCMGKVETRTIACIRTRQIDFQRRKKRYKTRLETTFATTLAEYECATAYDVVLPIGPIVVPFWDYLIEF